MSTEFELFKGTNFSDLMKDIYHNSKKKARQIDTLIKSLEPMIKNTGDATVIVPMIKDYLEVSVKNDDALVKLAAVCQRLVSASGKDDDVDRVLTSLGQKQATATGIRLKEILEANNIPKINRMYHSTMIRAKQTSDIILLAFLHQ